MVSECRQHHDCLESAVSQAEEICRKKGIRFTKLRKRILEMIWAGHTPRKAYDLLAEYQKEDAAAKPSTIYRTLDFLQEHRLIHRINALNAYIGCVSPEHEDSYFLLVCTECNVVKESTSDEYHQFLNQLTQKNQFYSATKVLEIEGKCNNCS